MSGGSRRAGDVGWRSKEKGDYFCSHSERSARGSHRQATRRWLSSSRSVAGKLLYISILLRPTPFENCFSNGSHFRRRQVRSTTTNTRSQVSTFGLASMMGAGSILGARLDLLCPTSPSRWAEPASTDLDFAEDWVTTHEMVHLAFPSVAEEHHWSEEGLATYVEPIARARIGELSAKKVWGDMMDGMPKGLPEPGDRGLDFTHTWGRTYWGGALFCLLADVEFRKRTGNQRGLEDALRGILKAGGSIESEWTLARALEIADRAAGVSVLEELYEKMKAAPFAPDLGNLWQQLRGGPTWSRHSVERFCAARGDSQSDHGACRSSQLAHYG